MAKRAATAALAGACCFGLLQVVPAPPPINPKVEAGRRLEAHIRVTQEAGAILARACANCHSNETRWPWYSRVVPVSWLLEHHVEEGRRAMNFSDWPDGRAGAAPAMARLAGVCAAAESGVMPPRSYLLLHPEARLTAVDKRALCAWANTEIASLGTGRREGQ